MKVSTKKVGFKLLPESSGEDCHGDEEKKTDDGLNVTFSASPPQQLTTSGGLSSRLESPPTLAISQKQVSTPSTCSPASSAASTPTNNAAIADTNNNTNNKGFRRKFRLPRYFTRRRSSGASIQCEASEEEEATGEESENDPVMAVFQSRYKNRVRWSLDDQPVAEKYTPDKKPSDGKDDEAANTTRKNEETVHNKAATARDAQPASGPPTGTGGNTSAKNSNNHSGSNSMSIKKFVTGALFGGAGSNKSASDKEFQNEVAKEVEAEKDLVWESNTVSPEGGEILYTSERNAASPESQLTIAFSEDPKTRTDVLKLIKKGKRAQSEYYRYEYAVNYFVRALDMLTEAKYPEMHPTVRKTLDCLNDAHHKLSSFNNSANIVKIGIKYEDAGELVRALKMYSIAYRIRRDNLSRTHPSLVVLLNMLGSIQTKRGEYEEAMKIYELALKDTSKQDHLSLEYPDTLALTPTAMSSASAQNDDDDDEASQLPPPPPPAAPQPSQLEHDPSSSKGNLLARSVTYREMGTIFEKWDRREEALRMYHLSLDCVAEWKEAAGVSSEDKGLRLLNSKDSVDDRANPIDGSGELDKFMDTFHVKKSYASLDHDDQTMEKGEMEIGLAIVAVNTADAKAVTTSTSSYDSFFPPHLETINAKKGRSTASAAAMARGDTEGIDRRDDYADIDVALTIHQIAQLFRKEGEFSKSLDAYAVALRGMKYSLGNYHPNVAAVLGNYGNLQKEMGDLNAAYDTYQEVLGIESYRLGLSHPDVAITLHNIATIDSARGNHERALKLYEQVMCLQKKLFGGDHISIAVTSACMGDVYEALGQMKDAFETYEDALRIKSELQGNHSLEAARLLHKLAKVALKRGDHRLACNYISRAIFVYRLNKIPDDHEWVVDGHRDSADIDASIALAKNMTYEC